jgi:glutamate synthase domain-containing protein 3
VGIATQRPELRAKFAATPAMIESYLLLVAEEVRRHLATLGLQAFEEAVGRSELLRRRSVEGRSALLELEQLLVPPVGEVSFRSSDRPVVHGSELGEALAEEPRAEYAIRNGDRAVGARLAGRLARSGEPESCSVRFTGSAGQSFGAFLPAGVEFVLEGEANDYVGKSLSGGRIVIRPPSDDAGEPCLVGNTVLYGATSGELFCAGSAGERLAVRNSGATVVVEGAGSNACEYMTNGTVVIMGEFGRNLAAGMTGGEAFVHDPDDRLALRLNWQLVSAEALDGATGGRLRTLLERHHEHTGSVRAAALLAAWEREAANFRVVRPRDEVQRIEADAEGTESGDPDADRGDVGVGVG